MTEETKIALVKAQTDETDETVISAFLEKAGKALLHFIDPYHTGEEDKILAEYADLQLDAASYYLNKRGWDFQTAHTENGISRTFETGDLPDSILRRITPRAGATE